MKQSFESLLEEARHLQRDLVGLASDDQVVMILKALMRERNLAQSEAIELAEIALLHREDH